MAIYANLNDLAVATNSILFLINMRRQRDHLHTVAGGRCNEHYLCWSVRPLGFHSVIRMLTQRVGFCGSGLVLTETGWRADESG